VSNEDAREEIVGELVARNRLWPLIDSHSCRFCAQPRKPEFHRGFATCYSCKKLRETYENALADLVPITYSTRTWRLGKGLRIFKDKKGARPGHKLALRFGAVLSLYLEHQMPRLAPIDGFTMVIAAPSSKPVIANSLKRAAAEGWWTPQLSTGVIGAKEGSPRQRQRSGKDRRDVRDKWVVDEERVLGQRILLLDDFVTTGGTIHSLAHALRVADAESVTAVVLARNLGDEDGEWVLPELEAAVAEGRVWTHHQNKRDVIK
jgi:hypothetical protein